MKKAAIFTSLLAIYNCISYSQVDSVDTETVTQESFLQLSLEDLLNMQVTSISKKSERLQDVASSIYVVTSEDIKNSGATNLHEVLRSVPGYWATQTEYNSVSLPSIRNSPSENGITSDVLYVLDGTPLLDNLSSTFTFENFDIPLDEIDRIEVIRGSGGVVYGANSAAGVINIFTKNPEKYDGITSKVEVASPGYTSLSIRAGGSINDKLSISGYGKARIFGGYGLQDEFDGEFVTVPKTDGTGDTTILNRFTEDYESTEAYSFGFKAVYNLSEADKFSFNSHANIGRQIEYTNYDTELSLLGDRDVLIANDVTRTRLVGNLRYEHTFNDDHSLFARLSSNYENDFVHFFGGHDVNNSIIDLEIQDNFSLGEHHDLSVGGNFRLVNFDVDNILNEEGVIYIDPQNTETLNGIFAQDKIKLLDGKLNFLVGIKAENYSLINNNYYLSPSVKASFIPNENLTIWGGFTQSFTTPGYQLTNIDLLLVNTPSDETIQGIAFQTVFQTAFQTAIANGADEATANAQAESFVASAEGQATIAGTANGINSQLPNDIGVINGSETVPTRYQTWELGARTTLENVLSLESNFYYSVITDAVASSPAIILTDEESDRRPGQLTDYFLFGNYIDGITFGLESMVKISPSKEVQFEISHVYNQSKWEFKENDDFDINDRSIVSEDELDQTPETPRTPKHVIRLNGTFQLPKGIVFSTDVIYATKFFSQGIYSFEEQRFPRLTEDEIGIVVGENQSRTIVNLKVQKNFLDDALNVYVFGNDILNPGIIANTNSLGSGNTTLSQIGAMFGVGASYQF